MWFVQLYLTFGLIVSTFTAVNVLQFLRKFEQGETCKCWGKDRAHAIQRAVRFLDAYKKFKHATRNVGKWLPVMVFVAITVEWFKNIFIYPRSIYRWATNKEFVRVSRVGIL